MLKNIAISLLILLLLAPCALAKEEVKKSKAQDYRISPHDLLEISIYPQSDLNAEVEVDSNGYIFFAFLGNVEVSGLTADEASDKLAELLEKDYLINPRVIIMVKESKGNVIIVIGEVNKPGTYNYKLTGMTLMEAISEAGGFSGIAWVNGTKIVRAVNGKEESIKARVGNILNGKEKDILLKPGDIIVVPESLF